MIENKKFAGGGLDKDSSPENVAPNDVIGGYNVRFTGTEEGEKGIATDIDSNQPIASTVPAGLSKGIGSEGFESVRKGYGFRYNAQGFNQIVEIDIDTEIETVLFTDKTDSGGISILPLDPQFYVNDIKLAQDKFLVWTDSKTEVGYVSLERLKSGELGVLTKDDIRLIKAPSLKTPTSYYADDVSRSINLLRNNLFQFIFQHEYLDGEHSAWGSISKRAVPNNESTPTVGTNVGRSNNLVVTVDAGSNRVKIVNIGARIGNLDFMLIKSIPRAEIIAIQNDTFATGSGLFEAYDPSLTGVYEVYNPSLNTYSFAFYNDGLYPNIDVLETDLYYDHIPKTAGALELLNGNVLALGDITEGYERPTVDVSITQTSYNPEISVEIDVTTNNFKLDTYTQSTQKIKGFLNGFKDEYYRYEFYFSGVVKTNDKIEFAIQTGDKGELTERYEITATVAENLSNELFIKKIIKELPRPASYRISGDQIILTVNLKTINQSGYDTRERLKSSPKITLALAGSGESKSIGALKTNSSYQLALGHKDHYGRYFPIVTDNRFIVKTQSLAQLEGQLPILNWKLNNAVAPKDAESYQWLLSENTTHLSNLYTNAVLDTTNTDADYLVFKLNTLEQFNKNNTSSVLSYDYSPGDRCTFVWVQPATGDKKWFNSPKVVDVEVVGYEVRVTGTEPEPIVTDYLLKVRKSSEITSNTYNGQTIAGVDILLEIYTPRKRTTEVEGKTVYNSTVFYEIGEEYPIVNGNYSKLTGDIKEGDSYFKTRQMVNAVDAADLNVYEVEDFNFSDFYKSNHTSYGRVRTYEDETGETRKKSSIRYSGTAMIGFPVNGITRFFKERIYGDGAGESSSNYGAINKLFQRDNYLICIQETKVGHIPVYSRILEDNEGNENVAISDRIFGNIRYIQSGSWGMGGAKESFAKRQDGTIYFVDFNNSLPIRNGFDGVKPISGKMTKFFKRVIQQAKKDGKKIIGIYDNFNDEYLVTIEGSGDILTQIIFTDADWKFTEDYVINPATLLSTGTSNGTVFINTTTGVATFTPTHDYIGNAGFGFSFVANGQTITKNSCGVITAGSKAVDTFVFIDVTDADVSTPYESNDILVSGNDIGSPISITGGEYSINGGAYTSVAGTVTDGDSVRVRLTTTGTYSTANNAVLTIHETSDTFTVTTKASVPVSYSVAYGLNPITQNGLIFTRNGVEVARFGSEGSGTLTNMFGQNDVVGIRQFSYGFASPWEANSTANLQVSVNSVSRFNGNITVQAIELQSDSFTIASGTTAIDVVSAGTSTAVGYITKVLNVTSDTTLAKLEVTDTTPPKKVLEVTDAQTGSSVYPYNLFVDGNTQTLKVTNNSPDFTLNVTVNGGSVQTIGVSTFFEFTGIVKDSINVTLTQNIP